MSQSPSIAYPGGKARLAQEITAFLPRRGRTYVEPFVGRGNLFWSAASAGLKYERWWLNDTSTIPFFRAIKEIGDVIEVPEDDRAEYERQREPVMSGHCFRRTCFMPKSVAFVCPSRFSWSTGQLVRRLRRANVLSFGGEST
jgi:hypothetical protein